ncbi:MAG: hypothetical protein QOE82_3419 [Thermoanaerobaculia bacterium]|jgi:hypothetical protein|nr:hypothetical protein [Thermoanaerobaculia bacterium]
MPQLHLYVPDDVAETAKSRARAAGKSLSSYLADLVIHEVAGEWPEGFFEKVVGGWKGELLERGDQGQFEKREPL